MCPSVAPSLVKHNARRYSCCCCWFRQFEQCLVKISSSTKSTEVTDQACCKRAQKDQNWLQWLQCAESVWRIERKSEIWPPQLLTQWYHIAKHTKDVFKMAWCTARSAALACITWRWMDPRMIQSLSHSGHWRTSYSCHLKARGEKMRQNCA